MEPTAASMAPPNRAAATASAVCQRFADMTSMKSKAGSSSSSSTPRTTSSRLAASLDESPTDHNGSHLESITSSEKTVLYLAYGSNLCNETFRGKRGIKPLSQVNVQVPSLRLTFDLPGIAYLEPCFANSGKRDPANDAPRQDSAPEVLDEKSPLLTRRRDDDDYRKNQWHKGLIGVVYEVTAEDYAHIIATEGGGSSYHDILVDCHPFATADPTKPVPQTPTLPSFKAHTLFAPATDPGEDPPADGGRFQRPDTSYAQASARYLKLITDGAAELQLPYEYQDYLHSLRPYTVTNAKQRIGQFVFLSIWVPIVMMVFGMGKLFVDDKGRQPAWMKEFTGAVFKGAWASYDDFFKPLFGDGERTISDGGEESNNHTATRPAMGRAQRSWRGDAPAIDVEKVALNT